MRVNRRSIHQEAKTAPDEFSPDELKKLRVLLRRLRFLEQKVKETGGVAAPSGGGAFAEWEEGALQFVLSEIGYLEEVK